MTTINDIFPSKYLNGDDLKGDTPATIKAVRKEEGFSKGEKSEIWVVYLNELPKGLRLNSTVARQIKKLHGKVIEKWVGKRITLYPTQIKAFGDTWDVCNVRPIAPPVSAPANGGKPDRAGLVDRYNTLATQAQALNITTEPVEALTEDEIIEAGKALKAMIEARTQPESA